MAKILLVDDSSFQRKNLSKVLVEMGHQVLTAQNGRDGLEQAESEHPDLIITDLLMPEMDGISLLRILKRRSTHIPTIVASADIQESTRTDCLRLGARAFLNKPLKTEDIRSAIGEALSSTSEERV